MARIRTIKPEFWDDEKVAKLPIPCRLFFIGTWNFADDFGVIKGNASLLKSQIFPYDENLRVSEISKWIDALVDARMLVPISHDGESYYYIRTFRSHQILDNRYRKSYIGKDIAEELINSALQKTQREHNVNTTSSLREHDVGKGKEKESNTVTFSNEKDNSSGEYTRMREENSDSDYKSEKAEKEKSCAKKEKDPEVVMAEVCEAVDPFRQVFDEWFEYKLERKESYKSSKSREIFEKQLRELSGNDLKTARKIIEQSIANNWAGIFELKTRGNGRGKNGRNSPEQDDYELMQEIAFGSLRGREERERRALRDQ